MSNFETLQLKKMEKAFRNFTKLSLILVYLVIIAGATVRMTGSGMGCPDWPKCFGYLVPPTSAEELQWQPQKIVKKGHVIIKDETLKVAKTNFTTSKTFNTTNWENYTKHDYAVFNPFHTWIEFINRLLGALAGFATLLMAIASFWFWKEKKHITLLSWVVVFAMTFQAWLGATVVYSVLEPVKITIHMVMAIAIVALILYIYKAINPSKKIRKKDSTFKKLLIFATFLTIVQIVFGTQVRQFIDEQIDVFGKNAKNLWLQNPNITFYVHRSFSILVLAINLLLFIRNKRLQLNYSKINWVIILISLEIVSGILMSYFNFPFTSQPIHLVLAIAIISIQFYMILEVKEKTYKTVNQKIV